VQTVIHEGDAVFQVRWNVTDEQLFEDTAGNEDDGERVHNEFGLIRADCFSRAFANGIFSLFE
jgi:hypothetical protein